MPQNSEEFDPSRPRPASSKPQRPDEPQLAGGGAVSPMDMIDDDDSVIVPAPSEQMLAPKPHRLTSEQLRVARSVLLRRTMIPILLTCGVMLPLVGILWFTTDPNSVIRNTGRWLPLTLIGCGVVLILLAILNMAQVKHLLSEQRRGGVGVR